MIKYYTDIHDVDEDLRTAAGYGGWWGEESWTGIFRSSIDNVPTLASGAVASKKYTQRILTLCIFDTKSLLNNSIIMRRHF